MFLIILVTPVLCHSKITDCTFVCEKEEKNTPLVPSPTPFPGSLLKPDSDNLPSLTEQIAKSFRDSPFVMDGFVMETLKGICHVC